MILVNVLRLSVVDYRHLRRCCHRRRYIVPRFPGVGTRTPVPHHLCLRRIYFHSITIDRHHLHPSVVIIFRPFLHLARCYLHPSERHIHGVKNHCRTHVILVFILISESNVRVIIKVCENDIQNADDTHFIIILHRVNSLDPLFWEICIFSSLLLSAFYFCACKAANVSLKRDSFGVLWKEIIANKCQVKKYVINDFNSC